MTDEIPQVLSDQPCPFCHKNGLTLTEMKKDIPYFGEVFLFSMSCKNCQYHKADVESATGGNEPAKYTFEVEKEDDMKVRVVKSAAATVKIPHMVSIEPGDAANGYISNVEGILNRVKRMIEKARDDADDQADKKKAKNMLKKLTKVMWGQEKLKIIVEDPSGNSAIVSERAKKEKLKGKK